MTTVSIAAAKACLDELISKAEQGEIIDIERHGKPVARLSAADQTRAPIDGAWLQSVIDSMPRTQDDSVRKMRDEDRY
ncbi:type II toxin-antitoxin system Phd/YefM family antitoxin [Rhizobium sp. FY34]|uniref:type II toxin-antitoxin system Phd/YefM family antitoxin n=1 Tax=Rhizobium sp. FY34 TaxID=2562309 RepID=UPI0010C00225|nr:type II toxin-antitoxin system Phd/YefM family antitoxin [Rhizobium sp. FY34]